MILIVGLGNPEKEYKHNRHNVGFMFLDSYVNELTGSRVHKFKFNKTFQSELLIVKKDGKTILLAKPKTFMNRSGDAVKRIKDFYKIPLDAVFIAHDDLDIPLGKFHIQKGVGPKLHNGIVAIEEKLGTKEFFRIRIGIENRPPENRPSGEAYVLQDFHKEEADRIRGVFPNIASQLNSFI